MKNYWLDKRYPLAAAIRDWRKEFDVKAFNIVDEFFHQIALKLASSLLGSRRSEYVEKMEKAAWDHVDKFDLRRKSQAVTYFTNVMKSVISDLAKSSVARSKKSTMLRGQASNWVLGGNP